MPLFSLFKPFILASYTNVLRQTTGGQTPIKTTIMRVFSIIIRALAVFMIFAASVNILAQSWEWVLTLLFGLLVFYAGFKMRPKRRIVIRQHLNYTE